MVSRGEVDPDELDMENPLGFLSADGGAEDITDAAYRFCRDTPGVDVVLSGTGNLEHLRDNVESFSRPSLPDDKVERLIHIFRNSRTETGQ
jgi:aryl-alcohol dehydrogenase-like predicted oxidoreductase